MKSERRRKDRLGRTIKTQADYARMMMTALVLMVILIALYAGAYFLNQQYALDRQITLPGFLANLIPPAAMPYCVPLALALVAFSVLQSFVATLMSRFYRNPKDELDEHGLYKYREE